MCNEEGDGKGNKSNGDCKEEDNEDGGKSHGNSHKEGKGRAARGIGRATKRAMTRAARAMDGKSYWEAMILAITNDKFCSLRANFMQNCFEQLQGKFYSILTWKWFSDTNDIFIYG